MLPHGHEDNVLNKFRIWKESHIQMRENSDKIVAFYQHTNNHHPKFWWWFAVVCGGLWWFACIVSGFTAYSQILVVICGGLR